MFISVKALPRKSAALDAMRFCGSDPDRAAGQDLFALLLGSAQGEANLQKTSVVRISEERPVFGNCSILGIKEKYLSGYPFLRNLFCVLIKLDGAAREFVGVCGKLRSGPRWIWSAERCNSKKDTKNKLMLNPHDLMCVKVPIGSRWLKIVAFQAGVVEHAGQGRCVDVPLDPSKSKPNWQRLNSFPSHPKSTF